MELSIPYKPHPKQEEVHNSNARFKIIAAGRRAGKTTFAINELIIKALTHPAGENVPVQRSWYICDTYRHAEMIAWKSFFKFCPGKVIKMSNVSKLQVELVNGHIVEFKGSEEPDALRGVALVYAVLDEYGMMKKEVWFDVIRASLVDMKGEALFIGTPGPDGSAHFREMFDVGIADGVTYKSWLFFTEDNPAIDKDEIEAARKELPKDIFEREFKANFGTSSGLIFSNFTHTRNVIPSYAPTIDDVVVGSIDPGLWNPTGALLIAFDHHRVGRVFKEFYESGLLASEAAIKIKAMAECVRVAYWVIDRSSSKRDAASGLTVLGKYQEHLNPLITAPNDPNSVWAGIDEVKKLFQVNESTGLPSLYVASSCHKFLWEIMRYTRYKYKWRSDKNEKEAPRKKDDHLMDCLRNAVMTKPWLRRDYSWSGVKTVKGYY